MISADNHINLILKAAKTNFAEGDSQFLLLKIYIFLTLTLLSWISCKAHRSVSRNCGGYKVFFYESQ